MPGNVPITFWIEVENKKPRPEQYQFRSIEMDTAPAGVDPWLIFYWVLLGFVSFCMIRGNYTQSFNECQSFFNMVIVVAVKADLIGVMVQAK